jgi:rhamnulose-1-phosphate aldolase/alcohol dehydrogenase
MGSLMKEKIVQELLDRSNRLGSNARNTNFAGGNTSAKGLATDPASGKDIELLWVKGSGGDLGTLTEPGLAILQLERVRTLKNIYKGIETEDDMVTAFDFCLHGRGGASPSIDTAMHALVDAAHIDHLHPDSGIAIATSLEGERITAEVFGDKVAWVPWRRPGFQLALDIEKIKEANPQAIGCILGGHGITAWGSTSAECETNSLWIIETAQAYIDSVGAEAPHAFGNLVSERQPLDEEARHERAAALGSFIRGLVSTDKPMVGHYSDAPEVLDFLSREKLMELASQGTSCPDHFLRTKVKPMVLDLPTDADLEAVKLRLRELHNEYREDYSNYYSTHAKPGSPAMRGADPAIVLIPGVGMFSFGANKQTARVAGEFYINAINVMRGAETISKYSPISDAEKFNIEYWALEEAKLQRLPKPKPLSSRVAFVTGAGSGIGKAIATRIVAEGGCVVIADLNLENAQAVAKELGGDDFAVAVKVDVSDENDIIAALKVAVLAFGGVDLVVNNAGLSLSKPLLDTTKADWDLQHNVMARGSFLVSRESARLMIEQEMGGDIIYIASKNSVFAGPNNIAYSATKADQAHQVRLLAAELGENQIRVNGINPDGVVRGSGIFAGGWGASRAAVYGVKEEKLGEYYAQRTLLKREVLPEHVANAVIAITGGDLTHTTGLMIPVDAGVAAAFLR